VSNRSAGRRMIKSCGETNFETTNSHALVPVPEIITAVSPRLKRGEGARQTRAAREKGYHSSRGSRGGAQRPEFFQRSRLELLPSKLYD
jgi:hypothetical protein